MARITPDGVTGKSLAEYIEDIRTRYLNIDPEWNIDPESPDGLAIAAWAEMLANLDEQVVFAYQSVDPLSAVGQQLNRIGMLSGTFRQEATASTAIVEFTGVDGSLIAAGTLVRNRSTDSLWRTDGDVEISGGSATVGVTCIADGPEPAAPGALSIIATPVAGVQGVTNAAAASVGLPRESDEGFRSRRTHAVAGPGTAMLDSMLAAVSGVEGVKQARVYENYESAPDENGVAPNSMAIFVDGGTDDDVLLAIASKKSPGCGLNRYSGFPNRVNGDTVTPKGQPVNITFFRADLKSIYVKVQIASGSLSEQDKERIKSALVSYSVKGFQSSEGFNRQGFLIGEPVPAGRLYTPVNYVVAGSGYVQSITVGLDSAAGLQVAPILFNELGVLAAENIDVEYV